jgi:hypothetical protein
MFGTKVGINFKGRSTVTSKLGALITLLAVGLGVAYLYTLIVKLFTKDDPKINQYSKGMSLLENPTTYNLSESKFNLGVAIFDGLVHEFVDINYFPYLLWTETNFGSQLYPYRKYNDYKPCNTTNGDFDEINLNANFDKWKQGHLINSSMCINMKNATLQSDYLLLGKGFVLQFE